MVVCTRPPALMVTPPVKKLPPFDESTSCLADAALLELPDTEIPPAPETTLLSVTDRSVVLRVGSARLTFSEPVRLTFACSVRSPPTLASVPPLAATETTFVPRPCALPTFPALSQRPALLLSVTTFESPPMPCCAVASTAPAFTLRPPTNVFVALSSSTPLPVFVMLPSQGVLPGRAVVPLWMTELTVRPVCAA